MMTGNAKQQKDPNRAQGNKGKEKRETSKKDDAEKYKGAAGNR
jgi:hypothetical protein